MTDYVFTPALPPSLAIADTTTRFPVRRIWCVGRNYAAHARELGNDDREPPFFFAKQPDMLAPGGGAIRYPGLTHNLHYEAELVVALKAGGENLSEADAMAVIFGYAAGIDLTRRDLQEDMKKKGKPWEIGKSFEQSAPVGVLTPSSAAMMAGGIRLTVNGEPKQASDLSHMTWNVAEIIARLSRQVALAAGDIIFTGTPEDVGAAVKGDRLRVEIDGLMPLDVTIGMSTEHFQCDAVVVGAGVVGLAIARALAQQGLETFILEKNTHFGMETSARNSEVIHAGIYYPKNSLKAALCVEGKHLLYDFCASHGVGHKPLGKLIVATHVDQGQQIEKILQAAADNGVTDLTRLSKTEIAALEPDLFATEGLFSPSTGIIDSHQCMLALLGDAEGAGGHMVRSAEVKAIVRTAGGYRLTVDNDGETMDLESRILINSAGLWAQHVAGLIDGLDKAFVPPLFLAKGNYVTLSVKSPFRHLVYPVPEHGGLGVHLTLDMGGGARFGPNVEWLDNNDPATIDYTVSPGMPELFAPRIAQYWPAVTAAMLAPGYSGVRPKTGGAKDANADFRIEGPDLHGLPGLVNLFAIESPGLTASLAIALRVAALVA